MLSYASRLGAGQRQEGMPTGGVGTRGASTTEKVGAKKKGAKEIDEISRSAETSHKIGKKKEMNKLVFLSWFTRTGEPTTKT